MAAGIPRSFPMTSSAADASSSATHISVATRSRPLASGVPLRSTTAATPAQPMATSVTPRRHVRPNVSEMITPTSTAEEGAQAGPDPAGGTVRILGEQRRRAQGDVGEVDARVGADEPVRRLADDEVTAPAEDADRLLLDQCDLGRRIVGVDGHEPPLGLRHDLLGDDDHVTLAQLGAVGGLRRQSGGHHAGQVGAGLDLADAGERNER